MSGSRVEICFEWSGRAEWKESDATRGTNQEGDERRLAGKGRKERRRGVAEQYVDNFEIETED